ncbi:MAG: amidohydrolase family protein [Nocardioides alkalitolerans]
MIDAHLHVVDFLQHPVDAGELAAALDPGNAAALADGAVVFGLPVKKKWALSEPERPTYYLDDNAPCATYSLTDELVATVVAGLPASVRPHVAPLICGFDPTDRLGVEHVVTMSERHDGWRGIGEVLLRHDDLTELTYGENARAGHPALDPVLELCRDHDWPLTFHQDASSAGRSGRYEYLGEVRGMLARHPDVDLVWAHAGVGRRVRPEGLPDLFDGLLGDHPRLHVDLSWELYDAVVGDAGPEAAWLDLVARRSDRFVLGSDVFGALDGHAEALGRWQRLTDRLPDAARSRVESENARRLWWRA